MIARSGLGTVALAERLGGARAAWAHGDGLHEADKAASRPVAANSRWGANYFPNVPLTTHDGRPVRFYDDLLKGKSGACNFMVTEGTEVCPLETASLVRAYKLLGERAGLAVVFYSISIGPKRDA